MVIQLNNACNSSLLLGLGTNNKMRALWVRLDSLNQMINVKDLQKTENEPSKIGNKNKENH